MHINQRQNFEYTSFVVCRSCYQSLLTVIILTGIENIELSIYVWLLVWQEVGQWSGYLGFRASAKKHMYVHYLYIYIVLPVCQTI